MKLAVLTTSISRNAGGLFESVRHLHGEIAKGISSEILGLRDEYTDQDLLKWKDLKVEIFPHRGPRSLSLSPDLSRYLRTSKPDLVHVHGIWQGPSIANYQYYRGANHPYLISPRGMLDPWALQNSSWKKKLAGFLFENKHLHSASCMHALCDSEASSMRSYGLEAPIAIIPNAVHLPNEKIVKQGHRRKTLLFLGRIHPKKGLSHALRAWAEVNRSSSGSTPFAEWQFVLAGWDQGGHEAELKSLCDELGMRYSSIPSNQFVTEDVSSEVDGSQIIFVGPAFGDDKDRLLRMGDAFILPSFSEGLPMSVLEAWSYRLPVLMTEYCNLPEGFDAEAAYKIGTDEKSISEGMRLFLTGTSADLQSMGEKGRRLVEERFTWSKVAAQMKEVYEWMLGGGDKPESVSESLRVR